MSNKTIKKTEKVLTSSYSKSKVQGAKSTVKKSAKSAKPLKPTTSTKKTSVAVKKSLVSVKKAPASTKKSPASIKNSQVSAKKSPASIKTKLKDLDKIKPKNTEKNIKTTSKEVKVSSDIKDTNFDLKDVKNLKANTLKTKKLETETIETKADEDLFGNLSESPKDEAELYDEIIAKEMEKEIVKTQRKKTAGRDGFKKKGLVENVVTHKIDRDKVIEIPPVISVKEFAEKTGLGAAKIIGELMKNGVLANINQMIDFDTAQIISDDLEVKIKKKISEASAEDVFKGDLHALLKEEDDTELTDRPPIIVVMGHVDHGKTSILDYIRETNIVKDESGGITQHIGAYQVEKNGKKITFLDTPGHEAFTAMRARGAKVTDIAILVVAADEGIKPQTIEAAQHAQEAKIPIIVAINKIDKPTADPDRVKGELGELNLIPEEWGGSTIMVPVSAKTGQGMQHLLDMVLLVADLENLKANPLRGAVGTVIEANLDKNLGPVASVVVNSGTLRLMDCIVVGGTFGRVKIMKDYTGKNIKSAGPSTPVLIAGISTTPQSGDVFQVVCDEKSAKIQSQNVLHLQEAERLSRRGMGGIISQIGSGTLKQLKLVLKADSKGSLEAIKQSIAEIKNDDVSVKIILSGVGNVSESDVMMAAAAGGLVMGFHTDIGHNVKEVAERENVEVLQYTVIYKLLDDIKKILTGLLEPEIVEVVIGKAEVKQIFMTKKKEMIVGCKVIEGKVQKERLRVFRDKNLVGEGRIETLKKGNNTVHEILEGHECGILYSGFMPLNEGDILEVYKNDKRIRTL